MFQIMKRYQYRGPKEILWTEWFGYLKVPSKEEAEKHVSQLQKKKEPNKLLAEYTYQQIK